MDTIHYHVRSEGQIVKKAVYAAVDEAAAPDALDTFSERWNKKYPKIAQSWRENWPNLSTYFKYPQEVRRLIHTTNAIEGFNRQLRNSSKYVSYKDIKALMADLKTVYAAVDEAAALDALDTFSERWDKKYPKIAQSWQDNRSNLSTYFKYPQEVRRLIYTTNAIEGFNRQLRKVTKSKSVFPTDDSLLKMLYLAMMDITKKWTGRRQDWSMIHAQLAVFFADRMPD